MKNRSSRTLPYLCGTVLLIGACCADRQTAETAGRFPAAPDTATEHRAADSAAGASESFRVGRPTARKLDSMGYVDIRDVDPDIAVEIRYATACNFTGEVLYDDLDEAFMLPETARRLAGAQRALRELHPSFRLVVYDAARPFAVQRRMWRIASARGKSYYVANPAKGGGLHNYGAAVDVSVLDGNGVALPMGTEYDCFDAAAHTDRERDLVGQGIISREQLDNRLLLRSVMTGAGFRPVASEWWHFNLCSREEARKKYRLIDF